MSNKKVSTSTMLITDMDQNVKKMLKLIEEDGDSFAKKAEMYYEKRPELITLVEDFYRMFRSLSERYDHSTGEVKKNMALDIQSQGSCISELGSELHSGCPSPDRDPRVARRRSGHRAAGFDYFLGAGGNGMELGYREGDELSGMDSGSEIDALHHEDHSEYSSPGSRNSPVEAIRATRYEEELRDVKEKLRMSEEEVHRLSRKLSTYELMDVENTEVSEDGDGSGMEDKVAALERKLKIVKNMVMEKTEEVEELTQSLAAITRNHHVVVAEKAKLGARVEELTAEMTSKDDKIDAMHQEHVNLISETEEERKMAEDLRLRTKELEMNIEEKQEIILEGAEEKREAIRQLCFSLEHYRSGYLRLRDVVVSGMKTSKMEA